VLEGWVVPMPTFPKNVVVALNIGEPVKEELLVTVPAESVGMEAEPEVMISVPELMVSPMLGDRILMLPFSTVKSPPAWRLLRLESKVGATD
jgi:hypothetical protein